MKKLMIALFALLFTTSAFSAEWKTYGKEDLLSGVSKKYRVATADTQDYSYFGKKAIIVDRGNELYVDFGPYLGNGRSYKVSLTVKVDGELNRNIDYGISKNGTALFVSKHIFAEDMRNAKELIIQVTDYKGIPYTAKWTFN